MNDLNPVTINGNDLPIMEWEGQRVVTLKDIDRVHGRPEGTARARFNGNKKHFIKDVDYFETTQKEFRMKIVRNSQPQRGNPNNKVMLFTESGYLMITKSFTDDLAWDVQRRLINSYFRLKEITTLAEPLGNNYLLPTVELTEAISTLTACAAIFQQVANYSTINYRQQQELLKHARKRVNHLLGGAHSENYKKYSRMYFKNLWLDFCENFECGTYKDLSPRDIDAGKAFIGSWCWGIAA